MKKKFIVPVRYILIFFLLPVGACHKFVDWKDVWHKHKPDCRITKIIAKDIFSEEPMVADFTYNHKGDPLMVTFSQASTGRPHLRYQYDNKGRLISFFAPYHTGPNDNYEFYHVYQYDNKGRIVVDTSYGLGDIVNGVPLPNQRFKNYTNYEYGAHDRISKLTIIAIVSGSPVFVWTEEFTYGPDGNLSFYRKTQPAGVQESHPGPYDNKTNMHLLSKVWMFTERSYSRNNLVAASSYNKSLLPTRYQQPYGRVGFLYNYDISDSEIFYECKK